MVDVADGRILRTVRVLGSGVDLQLLDHLTAERALGQHAAHGTTDGFVGTTREQVSEGLALQATGVTRVVVDHAGVGLARGEHDLVHVDDDHVITGVDVRSEGGLVLATQKTRGFGAQTTEDHSLGIEDVPLAGDLTGLWRIGAHWCFFHERFPGRPVRWGPEKDTGKQGKNDRSPRVVTPRSWSISGPGRRGTPPPRG